MVSECFCLEIVEDIQAELLFQTVAVEPEEALQPIPGELERERETERGSGSHVPEKIIIFNTCILPVHPPGPKS